MSADNWGVCPKCEEDNEKAFLSLCREVANSYGKVPIEDFDLLRAKLEQERNRSPEETLREDYEFYREGFNLGIAYHCKCSECGWSQSYQHKVDGRA